MEQPNNTDPEKKKVNEDLVVFMRKRSDHEAPRYTARLKTYVDIQRKRRRAAYARRMSEHSCKDNKPFTPLAPAGKKKDEVQKEKQDSEHHHGGSEDDRLSKKDTKQVKSTDKEKQQKDAKRESKPNEKDSKESKDGKGLKEQPSTESTPQGDCGVPSPLSWMKRMARKGLCTKGRRRKSRCGKRRRRRKSCRRKRKRRKCKKRRKSRRRRRRKPCCPICGQ